MAHFGMLQEHKDMLRKNRLCLLERMNPEPVVQRLYQQNMMPRIILESIQALPTRYEKNAALGFIFTETYDRLNICNGYSPCEFIASLHSHKKTSQSMLVSVLFKEDCQLQSIYKSSSLLSSFSSL